MTRLIDADALSKDLEKRWNVNDDQDFCNKEVWHALEEAPTIEQPTGDLISRQDAIKVLNDRQYDIRAFIEKEDMEYKEAHSYWCEIHGIYNSIELIESLPSAETLTASEKHQLSEETPTNTPTDLISRDDAVALVIKAIHGTDNEEIKEYLFDGLRKQMWSLPSAEPKTGEWIEESDNYGHSSYFCSRCGTQEGEPSGSCPNCGADMRGGDDND